MDELTNESLRDALHQFVDIQTKFSLCGAPHNENSVKLNLMWSCASISLRLLEDRSGGLHIILVTIPPLAGHGAQPKTGGMNMLEYFFRSSKRLSELRLGPLGNHMNNLAADLRARGYAPAIGQAYLSLAARFSLFAEEQGIAEAEQIDDVLVRRFLDEALAIAGTYRLGPYAMRHVLMYLRRQGVIAEAAEAHPNQPHAVLLDKYEAHLRDARGLAPGTCDLYRREARKLVDWLDQRYDDRPLGKLSGLDVLSFIIEHVEPPASGRSGLHLLLCTATRSFLRYLRWEGVIDEGLDRVVPRRPRRRLATIPRHLPWAQVRALIDSIDTNDPVGKRDKAMLILVAGMGLRNAEIRKLECGQIAWRAAELRLPPTKTRRERLLPLPREIGAAVADYLLHGRPPVNVPQVFPRHKAPWGPLSGNVVANILTKHLRRVGVDAPSHGAQLLRHSLATRMVNVGVPIKVISDVLGHTSINTTAIYAKVDRTNLAGVALPFSGLLEGGAA